MHTDEHLLALLEKYDGWMKEVKIPYAGKILPIREAFHPGNGSYQPSKHSRSCAMRASLPWLNAPAVTTTGVVTIRSRQAPKRQLTILFAVNQASQ
jgi:hypothetical protein